MKNANSFGIPIAVIVGGLCLIAFGFLWAPAFKIEFILGGAAVVALARWLLVETLI